MTEFDSSYLMFCSSYTDFDILAHKPDNDKVGKGIYCFHFLNGKIKPLSIIPSLNPAVMGFHPSDPKTIYALSEGIKENGMISKIEYDYSLNKNEPSQIENFEIISNDSSHKQTNGKSLCYFKIDPQSQKYGIAINYWDGSADVFEMNVDNKHSITSIDKLYKHVDHMKLAISLQSEEEKVSNPRRQVKDREDHWRNRLVGPHAHSVHYHKHWVFIPDLGENCIFQYGWNPEKGVIMDFESQIKLTETKGPRHMVFHPTLKVAYVSCELSSSITVFGIDDSEPDKVKCRLKVIQNINTDKDMAEEADIWKKNYVAEIALSKDGKFIYCSNRGYDTLAVFKVSQSDGTLKPISYVSTYGKTPRHFSITPDNKYLIGANQDSNNIIIFKRDLESGKLTMINKYENIISAPNYVLFTPFNIAQIEKNKNAVNNIIHQKLSNSLKSSKQRRTRYSPTILMLFCLILGVLCKMLLSV